MMRQINLQDELVEGYETKALKEVVASLPDIIPKGYSGDFRIFYQEV